MSASPGATSFTKPKSRSGGLERSRAGIEALRKQSKIAPGSDVTLAGSGVAIAVKAGAPKPDISTPAAVKRMLLNAKSIAYPDPDNGTGASGVNVVMMLRRLGIEDAVKAKTKLTQGGGRATFLANTFKVLVVGK